MQYRKIVTGLWLVIGAMVLTGCGYQPSSHSIANIFADTVYVKVNVDSIEPENAPFIKDEMNRLVYTRFKGRIVPEAQAKSKIEVSYRGSSYRPLAYENGYVTRYRADVRVHFTMQTKEGTLSKSIHSRVESDIQASSLTSSTLRIEALRKGLEKALDEFLSYVSAKGIDVEKKRENKATKVP